MMITILLIADSIDFLDATSTLLTFAGFKVIESSDGATALELIQHLLPNVIICDRLMADMNGLAVHRALQASPATAAIPFILLTGTQESVLPKGVRSLSKPFKLPALRRLLDSIFDQQ
jgi:CheY-like chemotaxis protein